MKKIKAFIDWFNKKSKKFKAAIVAALLLVLFFMFRFTGGNSSKVTYQTSTAEKGDLIVSVTASGAVSSVNSAYVSTRASGVVKEVNYKDGDTVEIGATIATVELDREGQQAYDQALASYQSASNNLSSAQNRYNALQSAMFAKWQSFRNLATSDKYENDDGTPVAAARQSESEFIIAQADWLGSENDYKNQANVVAAAQTSLASSALSLEQASPNIVAPISGKISGLSLQAGSVLGSTISSSSSNNTVTTNKVASVITEAKPAVTINLTEIDVTKVNIDDRATITLDAYSDKTFTGKVLSIDKVGTTSSGVTAYPVVITLDLYNKKILPNMSASASILTDRKSNVLLVPAAAVTTTNGASTVKVLKNNQVTVKTVTTGLSNDTQTEITSGLNEGEAVVTSTSSSSSSTSSNNSSPFGMTNRSMGGSGGGVRIQSR